MATWLAHLRVAELINTRHGFSETDFLAGSVAPDCGVQVPGGFNPPKEVTHWTPSGKGHCDYGRFYREIAAGRKSDRQTYWKGYY